MSRSPRRPRLRVAVLGDDLRVAVDLAPWGRIDRLRELTVIDRRATSEDELATYLARFDVVTAMHERAAFTSTLLEQLPELRLLVTDGMANGSIDLATATARGVMVCGTETSEQAVVELTWALILALARRVPAQDASVRSGRWRQQLGSELHGKRLGVIGLGRIGTAVARVGAAFGMEVIGLDASPARVLDAGVAPVTKEELLGSSDVVTIHVNLTEDTRGLIGRPELCRMKPSSLLVNTSRGPIVDDIALADALLSGTIAGAALDVYDIEPPPAGHPLLHAPNTILTPHIGYVTRERLATFYRQSVEDIVAFAAGRPVRVLNPEVLGTGDRPGRPPLGEPCVPEGDARVRHSGSRARDPLAGVRDGLGAVRHR